MLANMKRQFASLLKETGFVNSTDPKDHSLNINSGVNVYYYLKYSLIL